MEEKQNLARGVLDPVCGMTVDPATASDSVVHDGKNYHFCCKHCAEKFKAAPAQYLNKPKLVSGLVTLGMPSTANPSAVKVKDPVCGMDVDPATAKYKFEHEGKPYFFCSGGCLEKFRNDSAKYLNKSQAQPSKTAAPANAYVCPMCPEVREPKPVPCPKCRMALHLENPFTPHTEYTCPMHPEVVRTEPGPCPIC